MRKIVFIIIIIICTVFVSCAKVLLGEMKLTFNESTPYLTIQPKCREWGNVKFYIIPIEQVKEIRGYPGIYYLGSESNYSFFKRWEKLAYAHEITEFALPDSICINKTPHTIKDEKIIYRGGRTTIIVYNKMRVADTLGVMSYSHEKKLTYNESTPYISLSLSEQYKNEKFYIIPFEKVKECRGYPDFNYTGTENHLSFFKFYGYIGDVQEGEIAKFALPDSMCINQYPNAIYDELNKNKWHRFATIMDNKMVVADY